MKRQGFKALSLEEQQWSMLDQALMPHKYEWLREKEEQENAERMARGKKPKKKKFNAAIESFRYHKTDIERIMETPFSMLSRREMMVSSATVASASLDFTVIYTLLVPVDVSVSSHNYYYFLSLLPLFR